MTKLSKSCRIIYDKCGFENRFDNSENCIVWAVCRCGNKVISKVEPASFISKHKQGIY